jgi:pyruvate/2-oxoglutarate dehydrogenase complex dihydrolipoamide acyltransferase (E2) component
MALALWRQPVDPQIYARIEVDMHEALQYAEQVSASNGEKLTPTHLVAKGLALSLRQYPEANAMIRWKRVDLRQEVNLFFQVAIPGNRSDVSGVLIREADRKTPWEIAKELKAKAKDVRRGADTKYARTRRSLDRIPSFLYRPALRCLDFLLYTLNLRVFGVPQDAFGSAMITSVESLGVSEAFAPLVPMTRVPILVAVGKVEEKPVVRDGQVVIRPICVLGVTLDHRVIDGFLAAKLAKFVKGYLADPGRYERQVDSPV